MKKRYRLFVLGIMLAIGLTGCGGGEVGQTTKESVTIALWSDQLTEQYGQYLQEAFPDVDFEFYVATNSTDFYRFKEKMGDLPDILTVRRFSLNDVAPWKDALMDLSDLEVANMFHDAYLRSYTYSDGTVNWLPACAEIDSILVNKELLAAHDLSMPTNYEEFVATCEALDDLGIRPFRSNFAADYTCMEILQGLSAARLMSQQGREWRQQYESGQTDQLSEELWLPIFQRMAEFIDYTQTTPDDLVGDTAEMFEAYMNGEVAMIRATSGEAIVYGADEISYLMPYFGETQEDNWYLTYPAFQVAANISAEENAERKQLILDIITAMLNEDGLHHITNGQNMIAYNKDVTLAFSPFLANIQPCLDDNRLYIRLASSDMFAISQKVVQGMITGEYIDAHTAFSAFNDLMQNDRNAAPIVAQIATDYDYTFSSEGGSPAASAVMNSLREELDAELLIGQASNVAGNILAGDYTEAELRFLTLGESTEILHCQMTGEQLYAYVDYILTTPGKRGSVINDSTLYVASGFEMTVQKTKDGYKVEKLSCNGQELERTKTYHVAILGNEVVMQKEALQVAGVTDYTKEMRAYKQIIVDRLAQGGFLAEPTAYITLK